MYALFTSFSLHFLPPRRGHTVNRGDRNKRCCHLATSDGLGDADFFPFWISQPRKRALCRSWSSSVLTLQPAGVARGWS